MEIKFEKDVCAYLNLPSLPLKEWDKKSAFEKGVAVINLAFNEKAYAIARFDVTKDEKPVIVKVFGSEPFYGIEKVLIVPEYMETDVADADLDEESKKKAEELVKQADEIVNEESGDGDGVDKTLDAPENPYYFDNITNDEEAIAFITAYNKKNGIKGSIPKRHDTLLMRLAVIYSEQRKAAGIDE